MIPQVTTPFRQDFTWHQGDTFSGAQFPTEVNGNPWPMTNAVLTIKDAYSGAVIQTVQLGSGVTIFNTSGVYSVQIDQQAFPLVPVGLFIWEIESWTGTVNKTYHGGLITVTE